MSAFSTFEEWVRLGALRWLHSLDLSPVSPTFGVGDREFWSWKTKDFANGTWQGGLSGLLDSADLLPLGRPELSRVTEACLAGTRSLQRRDGSFEEAYPRESSFAVTALVAFDLLYARSVHAAMFGARAKADLEAVAKKACAFLERTPETHGRISNHLATAAAALALAARLGIHSTGTRLWDSVLRLQDEEEGWFPEYGGADPGYQTLFNSYLCASAHAGAMPEGGEASLERSLAFLRWFCFADGTFAGEVGSRGTSIVYPGGLWGWKSARPSPTPMWSWFLDRHVGAMGAVTPVTVDSGNFVPVFNSWARARRFAKASLDVPARWSPGAEAITARHFARAKIFVARAPRAELAVSLANGAVRRVAADSGEAWHDASLVAHELGGRSTQAAPPLGATVSRDRLRLLLAAGKLVFPRNSPAATLGLRLAALLLSPFPRLQRALKRVLAWVAFRTGRPSGDSCFLIEAHLDDPSLPLFTESAVEGWRRLGFGFHRHMASANTFDMRSVTG